MEKQIQTQKIKLKTPKIIMNREEEKKKNEMGRENQD